MRKYIFTILLVFYSVAAAKDRNMQDQYFFKYGAGVFNSAKDSAVEVKTLSIGRQAALGSIFLYQLEGGVWTDYRSDLNREGSWFADTAIGINVNAGYFYGQSLWGVMLLTNKDSMLGSNVEFNQDASIGIKDERGVSLGINYKHISSAGIFTPNQGRDFMSVRLGIPF